MVKRTRVSPATKHCRLQFSPNDTIPVVVILDHSSSAAAFPRHNTGSYTTAVLLCNTTTQQTRAGFDAFGLCRTLRVPYPHPPHIHMCTCSMLAEFRKSAPFGFHVFDPTVAWISSRADPTNLRGRGYFRFIVRLYFPGLVAVAGIGVVQWQIITADLYNKYSGMQEDKPLAAHSLSFSWIKPVRDLLTQNRACRKRYIPSQEGKGPQTSSRSGRPSLIAIDDMLIHPGGCYR